MLPYFEADALAVVLLALVEILDEDGGVWGAWPWCRLAGR